MPPAALRRHPLGTHHEVYSGRVPPALGRDGAAFRELWDLHPPERHAILRGDGSPTHTNRWQQAYGVDYAYSGTVNRALPVPATVQPYLDWARQAVDARLNGLLLNWYDLAVGHNIGRHRDDTTDLIDGVPIVTISFGAAQTFRLRPVDGDADPVDLRTGDGTVLVLPFATNLAWTHEVRRPLPEETGRRVSVTLRGFESAR